LIIKKWKNENKKKRRSHICIRHTCFFIVWSHL
jgi:hypothetical protein